MKVLLPGSEDPTVAISLSFRAGSQDDPAGKEGLAYVTGRMLAEASTRNNSYRAILRKLYPLAAGYDIRVDRELTTLCGRVHREKADAYFRLFADACLRPAFEREDFERVRSDAVNYLENTLRYASDEELGKAALAHIMFEGGRYAHPPQGTARGLRAITLDDVRTFYRRHYNRADAIAALGGGYDDALAAAFNAMLDALPAAAGEATAPPPVDVADARGRQALLISKPGADASISFGLPLAVRRGARDFYALWIANSWLGEHRHQAGHLFQVIRELRGLNYGNYSYIEAFPEGGRRTKPPVNVPRRHQMFEVWIRTLPNHHALFALRAAVREIEQLAQHGLSEEQFQLTRSFLCKYVLHFADTSAARLGYAVDDRFYGIEDEGHLARFSRMMDELTVEEVNDALARHLRLDDMKIAIVTGDAEGLRTALAADAPTPIEYDTPKSAAIRREDEEIATYALRVREENIREVDVSEMFEGTPSASRRVV